MRDALDARLEAAVRAGLPGVVAVVTDRDGEVYEGVAGVRALGGGVAMSLDTVLAIFSITKSIAGTACLKLVEQGRIDLDAPAKQYAPALGELMVLDGFDADGQPQLRPPKRDVTTRMLMLHTAGFGYDFFDERYRRLGKAHGQPPIIAATKRALQLPLLFDPGEAWLYGASVDWMGQVVEGVAKASLGEVLAAEVLEPLGMTRTAFALTDDMRARRATMHQRDRDGAIQALDDFELPAPEVHMAGHGLYSTAEDVARFLWMWLNDGRGPRRRVLEVETVRMAAQNGLGALKVRPLKSQSRRLTHDIELFAGQPKSWALTFMVNDVEAPTGRPAGSLGWAGLANLYFWIDRATGLAGFWATQLFPFGDPAALDAYLDFETAVYASYSR